MNWIVAMLDRIFAVAGALLLSQLPTFMQQYGQQLAGHVNELKLQLDRMTKRASHSGKSLDQYIQKFVQNSDGDIQHQGQLMQDMVVRYQDLSEASLALNNASVFSKPFVFVKYLYSDIVASTFQLFTPGFAFSVEGLVYALLGILFGVGLFAALRKLCRALCFRKAKI